jgi:hypothetical protein
MPDIAPLAAAGPRELKRPRPIPKAVRAAITVMVYGKLDDHDCAPLDFIEAGKLAGIKPDVMRRYLDRADVRALLRSERRAFREAVCAGNELALRRQRDFSKNGMVVVASVRALEQMEAEATARPANSVIPGVCIVITQPAPPPPPDRQMPTISINEIEATAAPLSQTYMLDPAGRADFAAPIEPAVPGRSHYEPPPGGDAAPAPRNPFADDGW